LRLRALSGLSSRSSSSSSCVASKLAFFDCERRAKSQRTKTRKSREEVEEERTHIRLEGRRRLLALEDVPVVLAEPRVPLDRLEPARARAP